MKKKILILSLLCTIMVSTLLTGQELQDVEVVTFPLEEVSIAKLGIIVRYVTSDLRGEQLYFPSSWLTTYDKEGIKVIQSSAVKEVISKPFIEFLYFDGKIKVIKLNLPNVFTRYGIPDYAGSLSEAELETLFNEQESRDYINLE